MDTSDQDTSDQDPSEPDADPTATARAQRRMGAIGVSGTSLTVMVASTLWPFAFGVLGPVLLTELSLTPGMFGIIYAIYYASASLGSPWVVRLADRLPFKRSIHLMALGTVAYLLFFSVSQSILWLIPGAIVAGVVMASANPFTNSLITASLRDRDIRLAVGLKQSGVPLSAVLAGWLVPLVTGWYDWRIGVLSLLIFPAIASLAALRVTGSGSMAGPTDSTKAERREQRLAQRRTPVESTGLEIYALMLGIVTAGLNGYLPLFANNELDGSLARGGALLAAFAAAGAFARFFWSVVGRGRRTIMILFALPGVGAMALFALAVTRREILVWALVVLAGVTVMAWQGIGTIAIIEMGTRSVGRTSGRMLQFFYAGFVIGAPSMGVVVDRAGYVAAWSMLGAAACVACISMLGKVRSQFVGR
jgi:predicted MFS family arabinose efflux permease